MPAIYTHIQFGKEVAELLPQALGSLVYAHPAAFYLGTQGPDVLFYHKPFKKKAKNPVRKQGWDMHGQAAAPFFIEVAKRIIAQPSDFLKAYAIGFLCHFTLDSHCHPFIDGKAVDGLTHGKIEAELDKYQLKKAGKPTRGWNAAELFFPCAESCAAAAILLNVPEKNMQTALNQMRKINRLFSHKSGFVHGLCHSALTLAGMNKSFGQMFLYKKEDERCAPLMPVLEEMFQAAKPKAKEKIEDSFSRLESIATTGVLEDEFYRLNYSGKEK